MSAESMRKQSYEKCVGKVVLPQVVEDKSLIDSFTGFIQDVVPQVRHILVVIVYECRLYNVRETYSRRMDVQHLRKVKKK